MSKNILTLLLIFFFQINIFYSSPAQSNAGELDDTDVTNALMMSCYVCHNPKAESHDDILAPPLVAVKYRYKSMFPEREKFISRMISFIKEPSEDKALMRGPVRRFGVMPPMPLSDSQLKIIVGYIYDKALEEPDWFAQHFEAQHGHKWKGIK